MKQAMSKNMQKKLVVELIDKSEDIGWAEVCLPAPEVSCSSWCWCKEN